jgi:hypothetical protein
MRILALPLALFSFHGTIQPVPGPLQADLVSAGMWHRGCPVSFRQLRLLTVDHWGFDGRSHRGRIVVNAAVAAPVRTVFRRLYQLRFPIRRIDPVDLNGDVTASFECRNAAPSPCPGTKATGHWSMHAYGEAIDLNPRENPYAGCGRTRDPSSIPYLDRSRHRAGMVTPTVVSAFRSIGWGWGGAWSGTKDYMHFSVNGH